MNKQKLQEISKIIYLDEVLSTNDEALLLEKQGAQSATVVIANRQVQGKGRQKRVWLSDDNQLALSIMLKEPHLPANLSDLAIAIPVTIVQTLSSLNIKAYIKWPNDILVLSNSNIELDYFGVYRKVGGILIENNFDHHQKAISVIGIGLNVKPSNIIKESVPHCGFLQEYNNIVTKQELLKLLLCNFDNMLKKIKNGHSFLNQYKNYCATLNKRVAFITPKGSFDGVVEDISPNGSLIISNKIKQYIINSGEIYYHK